MNSVVNDWITRIEAGEAIQLTGFPEFTAAFPEIDFTGLFPSGITGLTDITLKSLAVGVAEDDSLEDVTFTACSAANWIFAGRYAITLPEFEFHICISETQFIEGGIVGGFVFEGETEPSPIMIMHNEGDWILKPKSVSEGEPERIIAFQQFQSMAGSIILSDYIPATINPGSNATVSAWELTFENPGEQIIFVSFIVAIPDLPLFETLSITVKEPALACSLTVPHNPERDVRALEGAVNAGGQVYPRMRIELPFVESRDKSIEMIDNEYTINNLGQLTGLLGGFDLTSALPPGIQSFSDLVITRLSILTGADFDGFKYLSLGIKTAQGEQNSWEIIPGVLEMRNITLDFTFPLSGLNFAGIVNLGDTELPLKAGIQLADGELPSSVSMELDFSDNNQSITIQLADMSNLGFDLSGVFSGLDGLDLQLYGLRLDFTIGATLGLTRFFCNLGCGRYWNPVPGFVLGNFSIEMNYIKAPDDPESTSFEALLQGEMKHSESGEFSFPVQLLIPDAGNWSLELGRKNAPGGIQLPGLDDLTGIAGIDLLQHIPDILNLDEIYLTDFCILFHPSRRSFDSMFFSILLPRLLAIGPLNLDDLKLQMNIDCTGAENAVKAAISCSIELGAIKIPVYLPLPLNSEEWTVRLYDTAKIPSLSYFLDILGFDATNWLSELFGLIGIPEMSISVLNLKFDVSPFDLKKAEIKAEFAGGISLNLPPGIEIRMDSLEFYMGKSSGNLSVERYIINGAIIEKISAETVIPVKIERTPDIWQITAAMPEGERIPIHVDLLESIIPGFKLPGGVGNLGVDIHAINLRLSTDLEVKEFDVTFDIKGFGVLKILKNTIPVKVIYENLSGQPRYGVQLLDWPFNMGDLRYLAPPYDGWVLVDLGEFGAIKMELPKFFIEEEAFAINGEVELTHDGEVIPLEDGGSFTGKGLNIPVKYLFGKMGMSFLDFMLPDRVPIAPEQNLGGIIRQAGGNPNNLPYDFLDYLDIEAPDGVQYDVLITSTGDVGLRLSLPDSVDGSKKPVKLLFPSGPDLLGLKFHNIGISTIFDVPVLNLDMEYDVFPLPLLVALSWFNTDSLDFLVDLRNVNFHFNARDTWILLVGYIPIPIFWDDLSFKYCGIEGVTLRSGIKFPRPGLSVADYPKIRAFIIQLARFISEREYLLQPQDLGRADLYLTLGPTWVGLPPYLDNAIIGTKDDVFSQSAAETVCLILNTMKDPALGRFLKIVPREIRFVDSEIRFGPIRTALKAGLTSVEEFKEGTVSHYPSDIPTWNQMACKEKSYPEFPFWIST